MLYSRSDYLGVDTNSRQIIWVGVFQYCFIRVFFTIVAVLAQIGNVYCQDSLSPAFAHVWVEVFEAVSVSIAMFCLIQFYIQLREDLSEHRPFLKVLCIKLVIFFSFWQTVRIVTKLNYLVFVRLITLPSRLLYPSSHPQMALSNHLRPSPIRTSGLAFPVCFYALKWPSLQ